MSAPGAHRINFGATGQSAVYKQVLQVCLKRANFSSVALPRGGSENFESLWEELTMPSPHDSVLQTLPTLPSTWHSTLTQRTEMNSFEALELIS